VQRYTVSGQGSTETEYEVRWNVRVPTVRSSGPATGTATYMRVDREYYQASAGSPPCLLRTITQEGDLPVNYYNGKYTGNDPNLFGFGTYFTTAGGTITTTIEVTDCLGNPSTSVGSRTELASTAGSLGNYISFTYPKQVSDATGVTSLTWNYSYSTQYVSDSVTGHVDRY